MNKLQCEMCGSMDLLKADGLFVCQHCGMKYTPEEARKMMIEGTVDVQGTVKVDNSSFVEKYLQNARRAKQKEDWDETEKYYNMVEQNAPTNIEAIFYSSYGKAKKSLVKSDLYERQAQFKVLTNCVSILDDNFDMEKEEENRDIILEIGTDILKMTASSYVYNQRKNGYGIVTWTDKNETEFLFTKLKTEFLTTIDNIAEKFSEEDKEKKVFYYQLALKFCTDNSNKTQSYHKKINEIDPTHEIPAPPAASSSTSSDGCYVATAVYGSYDCPEVWTLRRYRDNKLDKTWYGRAFIHTYYAISPTLVKWFGETEWFKKMWRGKLDAMVAKLQTEGYESTPYDDKQF